MVITLEDGHLPGTYRFAPSTPRPDILTVPDPYFINRSAYFWTPQALANGPAWSERDDQLVWRGAPNGAGLISWDKAMVEAPGLMPRCRLVMLCKDSEIDAGFVIPPPHYVHAYKPFFAEAGLLRPPKDRGSWVQHRYALDIDGVSNSWDNLMVRLRLGCCVLRVEGPGTYRQWYFDRLRAWEHYVPVKADLSDLFAQYDWVRANPSRAEEIAAAGCALASAMTMESELAYAARLIAGDQ